MTQDQPRSSTADMAAAVAHDRAGRLDEAEQLYARVLRNDSKNLNAAHSLGLVQLRLGRAEAAEASFARTLQLAPNHVTALVNRGTALRTLGRFEEAEACYRRAIALEPGHGPATRNLGILLIQLERHQDALGCADRALARGLHVEGHIGRGDALHGLGRFNEALESYQKASELSADPYEILTKIAIARSALTQYDEALALLDDAVTLRPAEPLAYYRRAFIRLLTGDFAGGWRDFEYRWQNELFIAGSSAAVSPQVRASLDLRPGVEDVRDRRVLLVAEQGVGDQLMLASMIPDLAAAAASVTCVCEPRLLGLFTNSMEGVVFLDQDRARLSRSAFDKVIAMGSLGHIFRLSAADFPGGPYLRPSPEARERWAGRLGPPPKGLRVGLSWRGGIAATGASRRSIGLSQLAPILDLPGCEFVSLQYGDPSADIEAARGALGRDIRAFPKAEIDDFEELAALIENLDVVVSVQTSVVHLTGALGKPCLAMVPHNPEWRYGARGASIPWYRSVRIFRQSAPMDWEPVIEQVAKALTSRLPART